MPSAEIIAIGTELLLGEIVDTNTAHILRRLRAIGLDAFWTSSVGDNRDRIAEAVARGLARSQAVITTGGLGPTVDDPTREAIAQALGRPLEFRDELWEQIKERFVRWGRPVTENNRRQAYLPASAQAIENPIGSAPGFIAETDGSAVICLPGVPHEMEHMLERGALPYLRRKFGLHGVIKTRRVRTAGIGEAQIDERIADLEVLTNPTVGLAARTGVVDIRITAKAGSDAQADEMIWPIEATLRQRLGEAVFGTDEETLAEVTLRAVAGRGWTLAVVESGTGGALSAALSGAGPAFAGGEVLSTSQSLDSYVASVRQAKGAAVGLGLALQPVDGGMQAQVVLEIEATHDVNHRGYGGPPASAPLWAAHMALELLRRRLAAKMP